MSSTKQAYDQFLSTIEPDKQTDLASQVGAFAWANEMENAVGKIRTALRERLIPQVQAEGKPAKKGLLVEVAGARVVLSQRNNAPSLESVRALCAAKGIALEQATEVVSTVKVSPSKLETLVARGLLTKEEYASLASSTPVLSGEVTESS